jgi:CRISPR-associated exonuclease Cas4
MEVLILVCIIVGLALLWLANRQRSASGLPTGKVVYSDTSRWNSVDEPLYSRQLGLTGKPDYLVEEGGIIIPIEVKSARDPDQEPHQAHIYQLAAYCLLVEAEFGKRPDYGLLHYTSRERGTRTHAVPFTADLEHAVREVIVEMQAETLRQPPARSHEVLQRCAACGFNQACDQVLTPGHSRL